MTVSAQQLNAAAQQLTATTDAQVAGAGSTVQVAIPQWEVADLYGLQQAGKLSGIPAWALAGIAENESGGEVAGPGINSKSGDGGYFGDNQQAISASEMLTASQTSFESQAQTVAAQLASYDSPAGVLGDIAIYNIGGQGSNNGEDWGLSADASDANALSTGTVWGNAPVGYSGGGTGTPSTPPAPATVGTGSGSGSGSGSGATGSGPGAPASTSSLYKALQSMDGWLNPLGTTPAANPAGVPSWLSDVVNVLTFGTSGLASAASSSAASQIASGPLGWLQVLEAPVKIVLVRGAFAIPGIIVLLGAVAIGVLGVGASGPAKNVLEVVDLAKYATGKGGKSPVPKS